MSLLQFIFSGEVPLSSFSLTREISSFMGTTNETGAETIKMGRAIQAQMAAQRTPVERHQPKYEPRKIPKTNKIDLQWAVSHIKA